MSEPTALRNFGNNLRYIRSNFGDNWINKEMNINNAKEDFNRLIMAAGIYLNLRTSPSGKIKIKRRC